MSLRYPPEMIGLRNESVPWGEITEYMLRARALLAGRDAEAVRWGAVAVDWMLTDALPEIRDQRPDLVNRQPIDPGSELLTLLQVRDSVSIDGMEYFPGATWPELLAAYGIARIGHAQVALQLKRELSGEDVDANADVSTSLDLDRKFLKDLFRAIEAIQLAERWGALHDEMSSEATANFSQQQRERGIRRHAETTQLQDRFFEFYLRRSDKNRAQAARDFLDQLTPEDRKKFTIDTENAVKSLTRGLRRRLSDE